MNQTVVQWFFQVFLREKSQIVHEDGTLIITIGSTCVDCSCYSTEEALAAVLEQYFRDKGDRR